MQQSLYWACYCKNVNIFHCLSLHCEVKIDSKQTKTDCLCHTGRFKSGEGDTGEVQRRRNGARRKSLREEVQKKD
jgi:hypothetical protein